LRIEEQEEDEEDEIRSEGKGRRIDREKNRRGLNINKYM